MFKISSKCFYAYLLYIVWVWMIDAIDFVAYLLKLEQCTPQSRVLVILLFGFSLYLIRNKADIRSHKNTIAEYILGGVILMMALMKSLLPDLGFDTSNYHIVAQYPGFTNHLTDNYGTGWFQVWGFKLGDRLFYYFRCLLGYRGGTILNGVITVLIFKQFVELLRYSILKGMKHIPGLIEIMAFIAVLAQDLMQEFGSYYVDLLAIPIAIECMILLLDEKNERSEHYMFALLAGILVCFKLTNIVFAIPLCIVYFLKMLKKRNYKVLDLNIMLLLGILPSAIYLCFNYFETKNPFFPYYNLIFKSDFWALENFKDNRWGPTNLKETILWPLYFATNPQYRQSEIPLFFTYGYVLAIIIIIGYIIYNVYNYGRKKKGINHRLDMMIVVTVMAAYVWAFTTGYLRYFLIGQIMLVLLAECILYTIFAKTNSIWSKVILVCFCTIWISVPIQSYMKVYEGWEWSFRNNKNFTLENSQMFKDYTVDAYRKFADASIIVVGVENHSIGYMIAQEVGINTVSTFYLDNGLYYPSKVLEKMKNALDDSFQNGKVYYLTDNISEDVYNKLTTYGFGVVSEELITTNIKNFYAIQIEKIN